jgi:hypothetical protein
MVTTSTIRFVRAEEFRRGHLPREILDAYRGQSSMTDTDASPQNMITMHSESMASREQLLHELRDRLHTQLIALKADYGIEPKRGESLFSTWSLLFRAMQDEPLSIN